MLRSSFVSAINPALASAILLFGLLGVAAGGTPKGCAAAAGGPTPGNSSLPIDCTGHPPGILLADAFASFSYTTPTGTNSGTVETAAYLSGGTLDFYYQITNDASSATALARLTTTNYLGYVTDAGYRTDGGTLTGTGFARGSVVPVTADSNADGSVIGFSFYPPTTPPTEIGPGAASCVLVISTDAINYALGSASVIDGGTAAVASLEPSAIVNAALTVKPSIAPPGTELTFAGATFDPGEKVNFYGRNLSTTPFHTVAADANGSFGFKLREPQATYGYESIFAVGQSSAKLGALSFQVIPRLVMNPKSGSAGGTLAAQGFGFGKGESVKIFWNNPREFLGTATADDQGSFAGGNAVTITIPAGAVAGLNSVIGIGQTTRAAGTGRVVVQ